MSEPHSERAPLLGTPNAGPPEHAQSRTHAQKRGIIGVVLTFLFIVALVLSFTVWNGSLSRDPHKAALSILAQAPVIDGHIDLPNLTRMLYRNNVTAFDMRGKMPGHVDIPRLRKGRVGGFFWSVYASCEDAGPKFLKPSNRVRDTLEQIDVARLLIEQYPDAFQLATDVPGIQNAIRDGKIASLLGVEGAHQLGNSIGVLRAYFALGVRYVTLTHSCNNAFADSAGVFDPIEPVHNGLSPLGRTLISEMNRIGMLVDLSHTSDATALQALSHSAAPVMWSHSSARAVWNVTRNIPDEILRKVGLGKGKHDAVIMVDFVPQFVAAEGNATLSVVADHIEHIARVAGPQHVGIGSDFDGIDTTPVGLEDVSKYPDLFAELRKRGWSKRDLVGLAGGNFLRVYQGVERVARELEGVQPSVEIYAKRKDL